MAEYISTFNAISPFIKRKYIQWYINIKKIIESNMSGVLVLNGSQRSCVDVYNSDCDLLLIIKNKPDKQQKIKVLNEIYHHITAHKFDINIVAPIKLITIARVPIAKMQIISPKHTLNFDISVDDSNSPSLFNTSLVSMIHYMWPITIYMYRIIQFELSCIFDKKILPSCHLINLINIFYGNSQITDPAVFKDQFYYWLLSLRGQTINTLGVIYDSDVKDKDIVIVYDMCANMNYYISKESLDNIMISAQYSINTLECILRLI
jgi:hypothetical protein